MLASEHPGPQTGRKLSKTWACPLMAAFLITLSTALFRAVPLTMMVMDGNVLSQPHITDGSGIERELAAMPLEMPKPKTPDGPILMQCRYAVGDTLKEGGSVLVFCSTQLVSNRDPCGNCYSLHCQFMTSFQQTVEVRVQACSAL